jgi:response regulator RpfG family c-di-GMP phosphodiesterase
MKRIELFNNKLNHNIVIIWGFFKISNKNNYYILLVDDEKDVLNLFSEYLKSNGYNIISFDNPVKALEYFYKNTNNCSVVITDYRMPQMSGLDFLKKIREKDPNQTIKTIIVSAYTKTDIPYEISYIMKIDKILEKPVFLDELKTEIQKLIVPH